MLPCFFGGRVSRFELTGERLVRAVGCSAPSKLIDGRVPQRAIEPRDDPFVLWCLLRVCHHLRKGVLQNILAQHTIADTSLQIPQKQTVVLEQDADRRRTPVAPIARV